MTKTLLDLKNFELGKTGIVCGLGPSLGGRIKEFESISQENDGKHIFVCCNEFDEICNIKTNYWVVANTKVTVQHFYERFNRMGSTLVYADSVDLTDKESVNRLLTADCVPYDQRHFDNSECRKIGPCCGHFVPGRLTIQEELMSHSGHDKKYGAGDTVALHMIAVSIILGLNPICISGVELDYRKGYVHPSLGNPTESFENCLDRVMSDFSIICESAKRLGIRLINLSKDSRLSGLMETIPDFAFDRSGI